MIKKCLRWFMLTVFALICLLPNLTFYKKDNDLKANAASLGYDVTVSAENSYSYFDVKTEKTTYYAYSSERSLRTISLTISLSGNLVKGEKYTVKYKTIDDTAVAAFGDYLSVDSDYTFLIPDNYQNGQSVSVNITIYVNPDYLYTSDGSSEIPNCRTFIFEVYEVNGNPISKTHNCLILGSESLRFVEREGFAKKDSGYVFRDYYSNNALKKWHITTDEIHVPGKDDDGEDYVRSKTESFDGISGTSVELLNNYADRWFTANYRLDEYSFDTQDADFLVSFYGLVYHHEQETYEYLKYYEAGYYNLYNEDIKIDVDHDGADVTVYEKGEYRDFTDNWGESIAGRYFKMSKTNTNRLYVKFENHSDYARYYELADVYFRFYDTTAPHATNWHLSTEPVKKGETLKLYLRMNEPVYVDKDLDAPTIVMKASSGYAPDIVFNYVGGSKTDTLVFELDPKNLGSAANITSLTFDKITNPNAIKDFGENFDYKSNTFSSKDSVSIGNIPCNLDTRTPQVSSSSFNPSYGSAGIKKEHLVNFTVNKSNKSVVIKYEWSESEDRPNVFSNTITSTALLQNANDSVSASASAAGLNGLYYLHITAENVYGNTDYYKTGPYKFDNAAPDITNINVDVNDVFNKGYAVSTFNISELPSSVNIGLDKIYMVYTTDSRITSETTHSEPLLVYDSNEKTNLLKLSSGSASLNITTEMVGFEADTKFKTVFIGYYAVDKLGNQTDVIYNSTSSYFDIRDLVSVDYVVDNENFKVDGSAVININGSGSNTISCKLPDADNPNSFVIESIKDINGNDASGKFVINNVSTKQIDIQFDLDSIGYYELIIKTTYDGGTDKYSEVFKFYLSDGFQSAITNNYYEHSKGQLLRNELYSLGTQRFYYKEASGIVKVVNYNNSTLEQYYSSFDVAYSYIYYNELKDLYLFRIESNAIADSLNISDGTYRKADGETQRAEVGQYWIRYKRSIWDNSIDDSSWVYYYYGTTLDRLVTGSFSANLQSALNSVSRTIANKGIVKYLTDYSGTVNGKPYLDKEQIHYDAERFNTTFSGSKFNTDITFIGDTAIYLGTVSYPGVDERIPFISDFKFNNYNKLFYMRYEDYVNKEAFINEKFTRFYSDDNLTNVFAVNGVYVIREIDNNGVRDFYVYVDRIAPTLSIVYSKKDSSSVSKEYDFDLHEKLYVYSFAIGSISNEIDELSYITIRNTAGQLLYVYTYSDLQNNTVYLKNGKYLISVYDRSGNGYKFNVYVDSKPLDVQVDVKDNYYIKVSSNRETSDIYSYEVWLNQHLISSTYSKQTTFEDEGEYRIRIEDLYGEVFEVTKTLTRVLPDVSWEYKVGDKYIAYGSDETYLEIEKNENKLNSYTLYSSSIVRFFYNKAEDYVFNVVDATFVKTDLPNGKAVVTITPTASVWSIEIAYKKFANCKVTYTGIIDKDAPIIYSSIQGNFMDYHDLAQMKGELSSVLEGQEFKPTVLTFTSEKEYFKNVYNGESVSASLIKVSLKDSSKIISYRISLNGKIIMQESNVEGTKTEFLLNKMGKYIIEATDIIGNVSTFTFTNTKQESFDYVLDGESKNYVENPLDYMKSMQEGYYYSNIEYAHKYLELKYSLNSETTILVTVNGNVYYIPLYIFEGNIIPVSYIKRDGVISKQYGLSLFSTSNTNQNVEYRIFSNSEAGIDIFAKHKNNNIYLSFVVQEQDENKYTVEVRTLIDEMATPFYVKTEMCGIEPNVQVEINGTNVELINNGVVYISKPFKVITEVLEQNNIALQDIQLYYSAIDNFEDSQNIFVKDEIYSREGFWIIKAKNIYGFEVEYKIVYSSSVAYFTEVTYKDGAKIEYSSGYNKEIYSNNKIEITIYTSQLNKITILKNGVKFEPNLISNSSMQKFIFDAEGIYNFYVEDKYGNEITHTLEIKNQSLDILYNIFTGWNDKALMKEDGYTNQKLGLDLSKVNLNNITSAELKFNNNLTTLFNLNVEQQIQIVQDNLTNCVGNDGSGVYEVIFRDKYGNKKILTINYRETTTLEISRTTRTAVTTIYSIEDVIANGLWSNDILKFNTTSVKSLFKVDGILTDCPMQLRYQSNKTYNIYYLDEYGFEHSFEATLFRQDIGVNLTSTKEIIEINKVLVTKGNISLNFDSLYSCVYSIDDSVLTNYQSGTPLAKDGIYKIVITDKAGNSVTKIIKRDTSLRYSFISSLGNEVVNGEIVNANKVTFRSDSFDDVIIEKALLDGKVQTIAGISGFTKNGKWEFVLVDGIGNRTYFSFYLMTYETSTFDYETPYNYIISQVMYDNGSGVKVSYLEHVNTTTYCSELTFKEEGTYFVVMTNMVNFNEVSFEVVIDNTPPDVSLVGCENNGTTTQDVTFSGYKDGDVINIYKDGELVKSVEMTSSKASPVITDKGQYRIEIVSKAGNVTVLEFTRQYTANKPTSILIISILIILSTVLFIGILYRRRARVD